MMASLKIPGMRDLRVVEEPIKSNTCIFLHIRFFIPAVVLKEITPQKVEL